MTRQADRPHVIVSADPRCRGQYLRSYDPEAHDGGGYAEWVADPAQAHVYPTFLDAFEAWRQVPECRPVRLDGKPNRAADRVHGGVRGRTVTRQPLPMPLPDIGEQVVDVPRWEYRTVHQERNGYCRLRVWRSESCGHVAVVTEIPDNPGMSVTNAAEFILPSLHAAFPGPLVVFEHYHGDPGSAAGWARKERVDRVYLLFRLPQWQPVWPVSPAHPAYQAHALWAAVYFEEVTGCPPETGLTDRLL